MNTASSHASEILVAIGNQLLCSATNSNMLAVLNAPLRELRIEGFVNGEVLAAHDIVGTTYRSSCVDRELTSSGISRSDLKDLSRSLSLDTKIEAMDWARPFYRSAIEASSEKPLQRQPYDGDITLVDVTQRVLDALRSVSSCITPTANGVFFSLCAVEEVDIAGFIKFRNCQFPVMLKPYVVASIGAERTDVISKVQQNYRLLHPLWILLPEISHLLVSYNREQLEVSLDSYAQIYALLNGSRAGRN